MSKPSLTNGMPLMTFRRVPNEITVVLPENFTLQAAPKGKEWVFQVSEISFDGRVSDYCRVVATMVMRDKRKAVKS